MTLGALVLGASTAAAQQNASGQLVRAESARNAGIYHVDTGTWTRSTQDQLGLGPAAIYRNDVAAAYFLNTDTGVEVVDNGRIPTLGGSVAGADRTEYRVNAFDFMYCTDSVGATDVTFRFYEGYVACTDLDDTSVCSQLSGTVNLAGLPGGAGGVSCWTLTIDLGEEGFDLEGDGGACAPGFDGTADDFGWSYEFTTDGMAGLFLAGDPDNTVSVPGAALHGGGGTYYEPMQTCASTGLDTQDLFWLEEGGALAEGCYFFGGYTAGAGCGQQATPFASFTMTLYAEDGEGCDGPVCETCTANMNSQGGTVLLDGMLSGSDLHLEATGGPSGEMGYFLVSLEQSLPATGGLCLGGSIARYAPGTAATSGNPSFNSMGAFDAAGIFQNMSGTSTSGTGFDVPAALPNRIGGSLGAGSRAYFQLWYRDGMDTAFSSAVDVSF